MALVKFGGGVIQMSGSVAGNTFARNRYGNYARAKTSPINPNTARQVAVRSAVSALAVRWSATLTAAQRTAWNLYADSVNMTNRLGETIQLSGFNHFVRSNSWLERFGLTRVDAGPTTFELPQADPTFAITASAATQIVSYAFDTALAWANEDDGWLILEMGQPQNAQRNFFGGPWRYVAAAAGAAAGPPVSPAAPASPFAFAEGQHLWAYARILRADGRLSSPFRDDVYAAA